LFDKSGKILGVVVGVGGFLGVGQKNVAMDMGAFQIVPAGGLRCYPHRQPPQRRSNQHQAESGVDQGAGLLILQAASRHGGRRRPDYRHGTTPEPDGARLTTGTWLKQHDTSLVPVLVSIALLIGASVVISLLRQLLKRWLGEPRDAVSLVL
jgi:hypothetical protein